MICNTALDIIHFQIHPIQNCNYKFTMNLEFETTLFFLNSGSQSGIDFYSVHCMIACVKKNCSSSLQVPHPTETNPECIPSFFSLATSSKHLSIGSSRSNAEVSVDLSLPRLIMPTHKLIVFLL